MEYQEILHRCFRCGYCKFPSGYQDLNCPSYLRYRFETFSPGGRMWLLRAWINGELEASRRLAEILFSCASCANCVEHCVFPKFKSDLLNAFIAGRAELVNEGMVPKNVGDFFKAIYLYGNPYKLAGAERARWAAGLELKKFDGSQEYLFYVGCAGSFDERGKKMAQAVARVLNRLGISFGILGEDERCDGNEVLSMGEKGLFEKLAQENIQQFKELGVKKIITLSPHAYNAFKNEYPKFGGDFQVFHYHQIFSFYFARMLAGEIEGLKFSSPEKKICVTFHDPCYLGRHNQDYETSRLILSMFPAVEMVEMERNRADALCCGGGGGNFYTDMLASGENHPSRVRIREALASGAEIIAVACPKCAKMLEDAVKAEQAEEKIKVYDLAELIYQFIS